MTTRPASDNVLLSFNKDMFIGADAIRDIQYSEHSTRKFTENVGCNFSQLFLESVTKVPSENCKRFNYLQFS